MLKTRTRGSLVELELLEDLVSRLDLLVQRGIAGVDHVEEEIGVGRLLEGGAEGREEILGQLADEADGVGEHEGKALAGGGDELHLPRARVEGGEELVRDDHVAARERVEQGVSSLPALV